VPLVPAAAVTPSRPDGLRVIPPGRAPDSVIVGVGNPVAVTWNELAIPMMKVLLFPLVMAGGWSTVSVKLCVALGPTPLLAMMVNVYMPPVPAAGVPRSTPNEVNATPLGRAPDSVKVGAGNPVAVTANEPNVPTVKVVWFALVIAGAWPTVKVKLCVAVVTTFEALMVKL